MLRSPSAVVVLLLSCILLSACGVSGRCTEDSQCPVGLRCDATWGECVGHDGATLGSPGATAGNYGQACASSAECPAGLFCSSLGRSGMCGTTTATNCPAGTSAWVASTCGRFCASDADCHSSNECVSDPNTERKVCWLRGASVKVPNLFGPCSTSADCDEGTCDATAPRGLCSTACQRDSDCNGGVCMQTSRGNRCRARCETPGTSAGCRPGYQCKAVQAETFGFCGPA